MKKILQFLAGLIIITGIGWLLLYVVKIIWSALVSVQSSFASTLITASVTFFVSVVAIVLSKHYEQKEKIQNELREKKIPVYIELIQFIFKFSFAERVGEKMPDESEIIRFFASYTEKLVVWASDDVVKSFYKFRMNSVKSVSEGSNGNQVLFDIEDLLYAIRKDLGHSNKGMGKGKIWACL